MMKTTTFRSDRMAIAIVGAMLVPTFAFSQDSAALGRTHVVRKGDTLWEIAREYTNDPFRWRQVYELNTATVRDPHWIYPGERLRLPGASADATAASAAVVFRKEPVVERPATATPQPLVDLTAATTGASTDGPTVFERADDVRLTRVAHVREAVQSQAQTRVTSPTLRPGEVIAAPYVESERGPANAGYIVATGDVPAIPFPEVERPIQSYERIFIVVPPGMASARGTRYVAVRRGPMLVGVGQVMIPTGVVVVERAQPGQAVEARVVARFDQLLLGDELVTMENVPTTEIRPTAVTAGAETAVLWVGGDMVLPSLQSYLIIAGGSGSGLRAGDQVTLYRERRATVDGIVLPESEIAVAQIVRVTPQAATAMIIDQSFAAIQAGTRGRVSAKMP
jgi:hypothetical protein